MVVVEEVKAVCVLRKVVMDLKNEMGVNPHIPARWTVLKPDEGVPRACTYAGRDCSPG